MRARFPDEFRADGATRTDLLASDDLAKRFAASPTYWLATIAGDRRPHVRPADGVFVDTTHGFGGAPTTRWVRHLQQSSSVAVSLPDDDRAVILEGDVKLASNAALAIADMVASANAQKEPRYYGDGRAEFLPFRTLHRHVYAWTLTSFPSRATRFDFATPDSP